MKNHYQTLGILDSASEAQIKEAFKKLAVRYHPDKHQGDAEMEEHFKEINEAYQVLSDPYKKAQFDLQLHYQAFASTTAQAPVNTHQHKHQRRTHRPYVEFDYKGNFKSTLYAFGITFVIALAAVGVSGIHKWYIQRQYEKLLVERRTIFDKAQDLYEVDKMKESLVILSNLAPFKNEEQDMRTFRTEKLNEIIFMGEAFYIEEDFEEAIRYYELVNRFSPYRPREMKAHLARSYRFVDKTQESLKLFAELIEDNYEVIATLIQIAEVYGEELGDNPTAKKYLELAREAAVQQYQKRFGLGYPLVITHEYIPYDHFYLFEDLGDLYNTMDEPGNSLGITNWMRQIWPDSASVYYIAGKSHELMGEDTRACGQYQLAKYLGHAKPLPLVCN